MGFFNKIWYTIPMKIDLPENVRKIIDRLSREGYEAYAVGGCVRDCILGKTPDDWDITTNAEPLEIKKLFSHTVDTGIKHGTVTVLKGKDMYEVTTYRIDGKYTDGRHPDEVTFTKSLEEDIKRRDFTINAMAYNDKEGLVDLFDGIEDLNKGIIRAVGNAHDRLSEDALRILRAIRFGARFDYDLDEDLKEAIRELSPKLEIISAERILSELTKLVTSPHPERCRDLYEMGVSKVILPEFDRIMETKQNNPHHCYSVGEHTLKSMENIENDKVLRFTMLFHDFGKAETKTTDEDGIDHFHGHAEVSVKLAHDILRRLKSDNETINRVCHLIKYHDLRFPAEKKTVRRIASKTGPDEFPDILKVMKADVLAQSEYKREEKLSFIEETARLFEEIVSEKECMSLKDLAVDGRKLIRLGEKPGPELGNILKDMLSYVLEDPKRNTEEELIRYYESTKNEVDQ